MNKLRLGWLYPNLFNLHGERGSVQAMVRTAEALGAEVELLRIEDIDDPVPYEQLDLIMLLPGEIKTIARVKPVLEESRAALEAYVERGGYLIALGTSGLLFGREIRRENGEVLEGLGLLDLTARERQYVWGDDLHFRLKDTGMDIVGSQIQMADVETRMPLGETVYGHGNNNNTGAEGARFKNLIYTNCLGPVFVKNLPWAEEILKDILRQKDPEAQFPELSQSRDFQIAADSRASTLRFIATKTKGK